MILIKMEMPKSCWECPVCKLIGGKLYFRLTGEAIRFEPEADNNCPLIELPPHGRLIDVCSLENAKFHEPINEYSRWWNGALESVIENAPTIIEAEEKK